LVQEFASTVTAEDAAHDQTVVHNETLVEMDLASGTNSLPSTVMEGFLGTQGPDVLHAFGMELY
jgi:hypothetical protein